MSPFTGKDITKRTTRSLLKLPLSSSYSHSRSSFSHINVRTRSDISKQIAANLCRLPIRIDLGYIYDLNKSSNDIGKCVCMSPRCLACWAKRSTQKRYLLKDEQRLPNSYCTFLQYLASVCGPKIKARHIRQGLLNLAKKKSPLRTTMLPCPNVQADVYKDRTDPTKKAVSKGCDLVQKHSHAWTRNYINQQKLASALHFPTLFFDAVRVSFFGSIFGNFPNQRWWFILFFKWRLAHHRDF